VRLSVIATGSSGNCFALTAGEEILLLDAGIPIRRIIGAVKDFRAVAGCLVTHEHRDHCAAAGSLAGLGVRVLASKGTIEAACLTGLKTVQARVVAQVGNFTVLPFATQHDAEEPLGFVVRYEPTQEVALYATDTYYLRFKFPGVNYWIVECNYVGEIVNDQFAKGVIDLELRNRLIKSHMSLKHLKDALQENDLSATRKIVLVHLSDERSDERRMMNEIQAVTGIETVAAAAGMEIDLTLSPF
jgi:phosphoribosyl 1,2-cyclic phosphodiesterase